MEMALLLRCCNVNFGGYTTFVLIDVRRESRVEVVRVWGNAWELSKSPVLRSSSKKYLGYSNYMQFVLNLASSIVSCFGALCGVAVADKFSRRKVLVFGTLASALFLGINGGLSARWAQMPEDAKDIKVGQGAVASYFFFNIVYSFAYTPLQAIYPVECLSTNGRAKGEVENFKNLNMEHPDR